MSDIKSNLIAVAGSDLFADSESFLSELTDSETVQVGAIGIGVPAGSTISLLLCDDGLPTSI